jgi:hypothetical protein
MACCEVVGCREIFHIVAKFILNSVEIQRKFSGNSLEIQWKFGGNSVEILWKFSRNYNLGVIWYYY